MTSSSFYTDGETYSTAVVTSNDQPGATTPSQAPSSFYPEGTQYQTLANSDTLTAEFVADLAAATAQATIAAQQAIAAAASAGLALQDETAAANSAAAANNSATNAAASATSAASHDASSATHDTNSATSATNAAASATTATTEAGIATTQAGIATTQASNASTSATNAASSATAASGSASAAATSATNAASSASAAATSASNAASAVQAAAGTATPLINGTAAVGTGTKWAHEDHVHPTDTSRAPLASPTFTGTPAAPTPTAADNSTKIATTAYVTTAISPLVGAVVYQGTWNASTNSPALTSGTGTKGWLYKVSVAGSTTIDGNSQWNVGDSIVFDGTTWDKIDGVSTEVTSVAGRVGAVTLAVADVSGAAPLASPALTGTPTAPTAAAGTNTTQLATTAFVLGQASGSTPAMDGTAAAGSSATYSRSDHVHPTDTSRAPLASPALTGVPTAPTAANGTNSTQLATTAFVLANGGGGSAVLPGYLFGLTLSTAGSSATFSVATGQATDSTFTTLMKLSSAMSKTTSAWASGTGNGGLDTGTIAINTWYHVFLIFNGTSALTDVLISLSATAPTMPSGYTVFRRIGSLKTNASSQWIAFKQYNDFFYWSASVSETPGAVSTTDVTVTLTGVPTGVRVEPFVHGSSSTSVTGEASVKFRSPDLQGSEIASEGTATASFGMVNNVARIAGSYERIITNTSGQITVNVAGGGGLALRTYGWVDDRGKLS